MICLQRLYNEPANQFVADFLGNPPINNIPGTIQNGLFVTEDGKAEAKLPMLEGVENGRKVNFSVRSESFVLDEKGPIACEVTRMYQMGKEEMAYLRMGGHDFRAYIDADAGLKAGVMCVWTQGNAAFSSLIANGGENRLKKKQTADRELGNRSFLSKIEPYLYLLPFAIGIAGLYALSGHQRCADVLQRGVQPLIRNFVQVG